MPSYYNQNNFYRPSTFGGFSFFPPVVKTLLIANVVVFLLTARGFFGRFMIDGVPMAIYFEQYLALMPLGSGYFYPWQLVTYQFLHADFWHLLFNMVFGLWMFGMEVEHVWGSKKFLLFYLACGVFAGLCQMFLAPILESSNGPVVGASGAVFGVLVAFAMMWPDRYIFVYFLIPVKVKYFVLVLLAFGIMSIGGDSHVANLAHLGGAFAGYAYVLYDMKRFPLQDAVDKLRWSWNKRMAKKGRPFDDDATDARIIDISEGHDKRDEGQRRIDEILDKIGRSGYQSLTEDEKKLLFEASKKIN